MHSFLLYVYFYSLYVSGSHVPIIRRINCTNATPDMSLCLDDHLVCRSEFHSDPHTRRSSKQSDIYQVSNYIINSPDDGHIAARNV